MIGVDTGSYTIAARAAPYEKGTETLVPFDGDAGHFLRRARGPL